MLRRAARTRFERIVENDREKTRSRPPGDPATFPLVNRRDDSPRNRFSVTAEDVLTGKAAREQGLEVVGWYHSHPTIQPGPANMTEITPGHGIATSSSACRTARLRR